MSSPPQRLGDRYEIGDLIGRGGMADVYCAHDTVLDRSVAVKMLRDITAADARRFADEARLLAELDDPTIVALLDAGVTEERPWLALELVEGPSLRDLMGDGRLDPATVQRVGRDIASALAHAHDHGIVHRDVKPSNVVLTTDGAAKLTDFGIARLDGTDDGITLTGHTIGTAAYLSPEQVRAGEVTGAADVYALGLVLLEALTSLRAYPGPATESALARLHHSPLIPTSLPPGWSGLLAAMTATDAKDRPDAADVARRLSAARFPAVDDDVAPTVLVRLDRPVRRRAGLAGMAAALALVGSLTAVQGLGGTSTAAAEQDDAATARSESSSSAFFSDPGTGTARTTASAPVRASSSGTVSTSSPRSLTPDRPARERRVRAAERSVERAPARGAGRTQDERGTTTTGVGAVRDKGRSARGDKTRGDKTRGAPRSHTSGNGKGKSAGKGKGRGPQK